MANDKQQILATAERAVVEELHERLLKTVEEFNAEMHRRRPEEGLSFLDAVMGFHNAYKAMLRETERQSDAPPGFWRKLALDTFIAYLGRPDELGAEVSRALAKAPPLAPRPRCPGCTAELLAAPTTACPTLVQCPGCKKSYLPVLNEIVVMDAERARQVLHSAMEALDLVDGRPKCPACLLCERRGEHSEQPKMDLVTIRGQPTWQCPTCGHTMAQVAPAQDPNRSEP